MRPKRIFLVRHGESAANVNYALHATVPDHKIPLTNKGIQQAQLAGQTLKKIIGAQKVAIYRSPFLRTRQTKENLLKAFDPQQIYFDREDPRLREQEWGHLRPVEESKRIEKERDAYGTFYYRIPDGESGADVYDRCTGVLDTLYRDFEKSDFPENVIIVSHGLTIRLLLMRWFHWSVEEFEQLKNPHNCQIFELNLGVNNKYTLTAPFPKKTLRLIP